MLAAKGPRIQLLCYGEALEVNLSVTPAEVRHKGGQVSEQTMVVLQYCVFVVMLLVGSMLEHWANHQWCKASGCHNMEEYNPTGASLAD